MLSCTNLLNVNGNIRCAKSAKKVRYGDFDPEEAFRIALARSYGEESAEKS